MKKIIGVISIFLLVLSSCNNNSVDKSVNSDSTKVTQVGKIYDVDDFDSIAANFVDKEIQVKGIVDHVCREGGKRLFIVGDNGTLHVDGDEKFDEKLNGSKLIVTGIVREFRIDEAYCLQQEQDNIKNHSKGQDEKEIFERKKNQIAEYRNEMKANNVDHLSFYTMEYKSLKPVE
jgi:hypothetical protein